MSRPRYSHTVYSQTQILCSSLYSDRPNILLFFKRLVAYFDPSRRSLALPVHVFYRQPLICYVLLSSILSLLDVILHSEQQTNTLTAFFFFSQSFDTVFFTLWFVQIENLICDTPVCLRAAELRGDHMGMKSCPQIRLLRATEERQRRPEKNVGRVTKDSSTRPSILQHSYISRCTPASHQLQTVSSVIFLAKASPSRYMIRTCKDISLFFTLTSNHWFDDVSFFSLQT